MLLLTAMTVLSKSAALNMGFAGQRRISAVLVALQDVRRWMNRECFFSLGDEPKKERKEESDFKNKMHMSSILESNLSSKGAHSRPFIWQDSTLSFLAFATHLQTDTNEVLDPAQEVPVTNG